MDQETKVITDSDILDVSCPFCKALPASGCRQSPNVGSPQLALIIGSRHLSFHPERIKAAKGKIETVMFGDTLSPSQKALLVYYAFIRLCHSCAANSVMMFGKELDSITIQKYFGQRALAELQEDGLIPRPRIERTNEEETKQ